MTKDNWIKAFDEKFPYNGCIFEDDGRSYSFQDIKSFISQVEKDAIEKTNKRWRKTIANILKENGTWCTECGNPEALSDLLEDKK